MLDHATTTYSLEHDPKRSHQTKNRHIKPGYAAMPVRTHDSRTHDKSYSGTAHLAIFAAGPFAAAAYKFASFWHLGDVNISTVVLAHGHPEISNLLAVLASGRKCARFWEFWRFWEFCARPRGALPLAFETFQGF